MLFKDTYFKVENATSDHLYIYLAGIKKEIYHGPSTNYIAHSNLKGKEYPLFPINFFSTEQTPTENTIKIIKILTYITQSLILLYRQANFTFPVTKVTQVSEEEFINNRFLEEL